MFAPGDLFDLAQTEHRALFEGCTYAWEALGRIKDYLARHLRPALHNRCRGEAFIGRDVFIGEGTVVEDGVMIKGPALIGRDCEIRHGAYLRENVIIGNGCVVGNACELKNSLLFNDCEVPHFNYVGDSILGHHVHLGAGVILSNLKSLPGTVTVDATPQPLDTGLRKFGALVGDGVEIGCNAVLNPGSVIGRGSVLYPLTLWRGVLPPHSIVKNKPALEIVVKRPRD
jgi:NDP-sugar pyrophosphorylase family protein